MSAIIDLSTQQDALRTFLLRRLDNLTKNDKMQITMISTWATELYLDKVSSAHDSILQHSRIMYFNGFAIEILPQWLHNCICWAYLVYFV
jgi:hypothetical protein